MGFEESLSDPGLFVRRDAEGVVYLLMHVDDLLVAAATLQRVAAVKAELRTAFNISDLGEAAYYLGMRITRDRVAGTISLSQARYAQEVLGLYGMSESAPADMPMAPGSSLLRHDQPMPAGKKLTPAEQEERKPLSKELAAVYRAVAGA